MITPSVSTENYLESKIPLYLSLTIFSVVVILYFLFPGVQEFILEAWEVLISNDEQRIKKWVENFSWFGPLILILAMVLQMFLVFIPTLVLMIVCILAYSPFYGSLIAFVAIFSASSVGYGIGRFLGPVIAEKLLGKKSIKKGSEFLNQYGFWAIFITRINPFLSNDAVSLISGIFHMRYGQFILASLTGIAPLIIFIAILGETTEGLKKGLIWISVVTSLLFVGYLMYKRFIKEEQTQKAKTSWMIFQKFRRTK